MKNRNLSAPILSAILLSLVAFPLLSKADPAVSNPTSSAPAAPLPKHTTTYTVVKGDSLTSIAEKFNTTRKKLKKLNNLAADIVKLKPGQVLLVPSLRSAGTATAEAQPHHEYLRAQPVQDFDIPASTFASCPVPIPSQDDDAASPAPVAEEKPAPIARPVSPAELAATQAQESAAPVEPAPQVADTEAVPDSSTKHLTNVKTVSSASPPYNPPAPRPAGRSLAEILGFSSPVTPPANDWGNRFLLQARALGDEGIEYDEDWRPPGESHAWEMDCSNTARYLYKVTTGIQLPRTASDQYYYLHLQGKAWDVPQTSDGWADTSFLRHNLKPGDLLFWENTYRPERQPPITHVMVFLGTNDKGQWIMAGSQTSSGGEHNRRNGGPDIYVFRPCQPCGGYTTWLGLVHHQGRFCAFGRPLEADPAKLAVAESD
ncbi:MAG TPA: LysM peptidoglycan-binding domain-containing protein [Candidatus Methylacidiphilales bacterium]|jgi:cell wall-associated NlpC family hydrolase|nr:LysM peptidoglycan-binding domain-containing protein [Candidatus Methylacidiphilales bacterium]